MPGRCIPSCESSWNILLFYNPASLIRGTVTGKVPTSAHWKCSQTWLVLCIPEHYVSSSLAIGMMLPCLLLPCLCVQLVAMLAGVLHHRCNTPDEPEHCVMLLQNTKYWLNEGGTDLPGSGPGLHEFIKWGVSNSIFILFPLPLLKDLWQGTAT